MEAVLTCSALTKAYGPNKALDNFTAVFSGGRITGLLGPVIGALVHNAGSVVVILNSALLLKWKRAKG